MGCAGPASFGPHNGRVCWRENRRPEERVRTEVGAGTGPVVNKWARSASVARPRRAPAARADTGPMGSAPSRGALERHDGQVASFALEGDLARRSDTRLALDQGHRLGAERASRPRCAWFEPRLTVHRTEGVVDLIGRSAAERHVRPMAVVPRCKVSKLAEKRSSPVSGTSVGRAITPGARGGALISAEAHAVYGPYPDCGIE